jgi:hypothetical protein
MAQQDLFGDTAESPPYQTFYLATLLKIFSIIPATER